MSKYSVYKHTSPNGKVYIGITKRIPKHRWGKNGRGYRNNKYFYSAIIKYGWDSFTHEILYSGISKEEAQRMEIDLISKYNSANGDFGYNLSLGGEAGFYNKDAYGENYYKEYREQHRDKIIAYLQEYYKNNKEKANQESKKYYRAHSEEIKAKKHLYYQQHKEEIIEKKRKYREAKKLTSSDETI